ncbi:DUF4112 domain-containing protein [Arcticibacter eurypsychrophilus]|uniref:DUF4112 domain-containing protein n=1 Tax=Arcticibacter eurypsychrophilus TaxID=1434752 RepID=UPI0014805F1A|nr:DUF4112 domain-containing protein [Arcticibacter eurypsychrophilus]
MKQPLLKNNNRLIWAERVSKLLDDQFRIPGTQFRFGLDPIINLIPFAGDISGYILSSILVLTMVKSGVSRKVIVLMILNISIDAIIGAIPFIGQIFDFYYKANSRNIKLLREHYQEGKHEGRGTEVIIGIVVFLILILVLFIYLTILLTGWVINLF